MPDATTGSSAKWSWLKAATTSPADRNAWDTNPCRM